MFGMIVKLGIIASVCLTVNYLLMNHVAVSRMVALTFSGIQITWLHLGLLLAGGITYKFIK